MPTLDKSTKLHLKALGVLAGGVNSSMRIDADPSIFFERGEGVYLFDADGNKYVDYRMGAGPLILGHSPTAVIAAVKDQLDRGLQTADETSLSVEVAARLVELIPCAERVRFTNSGSEAVHLALLLARAHRGRKKIVRFENHYHGWFDNIYARVPPDGSADIAQSAGQGNALDELIVLPWNDMDVFSRTVAERGGEIGGVIMTPIMIGTGGGATPREGYLKAVREICTENEIVLIFDEIITGFRVALGGAQELVGVVPDLATYAKAIAAGFPIAAVVGREEFMRPIAEGRVKHNGTYNGNPTSLAAARAALAELTRDNGEFYRYCNNLRQMLSRGMSESAERYDIPLIIKGAGAVMDVWFTDSADYCDYRTSLIGHDAARRAQFARELLFRGIVMGRSFLYITNAHTSEDVELTLEKVDEVMGSLQGTP